ncbi:MAG: coproporphyrinogen-III oxidase family protein [Acidobacteriota bacterium]
MVSSPAVDLHAPEPLAGSYFVATYPPFSCWDEAGAREYTAELQEPPRGDVALGLYLHVPFCVERCEFCYYLSYDGRGDKIDAYLDAVAREAGALGTAPAIADRPVSFAYVGGGTPSILSAARIDRLMGSLRRAFRWEEPREVTFECAPRTVTPEKLRALRHAGVTRVSMGVQQMDDEILRRNGRIHRVADVERAWEMIAAVGFPVVNLDLIVGMVDETDDTFLSSVERLIDMDPESITVYQLEIPLNTPLYRAMQEGTLEGSPASWDVKRARLDAAFCRLEEAGYSVRSAYTVVKDPEAHRFVYQDEQYADADLVGIGTSSFSSLGTVQHQNRAALSAYLAAMDEADLPLWRGRRLSAEERAVREMVLQWKLGRVDRATFRRRHAVDPAARFAEPLEKLVAAGMAEIDEDAIRLTRRGLLNADRVLPAFYLPEHRGIRYS